jgi:hypothetical protein
MAGKPWKRDQKTDSCELGVRTGTVESREPGHNPPGSDCLVGKSVAEHQQFFCRQSILLPFPTSFFVFDQLKGHALCYCAGTEDDCSSLRLGNDCC